MTIIEEDSKQQLTLPMHWKPSKILLIGNSLEFISILHFINYIFYFVFCNILKKMMIWRLNLHLHGNGKREKRIITYQQTHKRKQSQMHDNMNSTNYSISIESINSKKKHFPKKLTKGLSTKSWIVVSFLETSTYVNQDLVTCTWEKLNVKIVVECKHFKIL